MLPQLVAAPGNFRFGLVIFFLCELQRRRHALAQRLVSYFLVDSAVPKAWVQVQ
jgi:hypothetical protein